MLARVVLAASLVAGAAAQVASWTEMAYPTGKDKHLAMTSPSIKIEGMGEISGLKYKKLYRSGETFGLSSPPSPDPRPISCNVCWLGLVCQCMPSKHRCT